MDNEPGGRGMVGVLVAHVVCCGGAVLVLTGALSGVGTWLTDGGATWLLVAAVVAIAGLALWQRQRRRACAIPCEPAEPEPPSRHSKAGWASTLLNRLNTFN